MDPRERKNPANLWWLSATLVLALLGSGCLLSEANKKQQPDTSSSAEPDKVLFQRAMDDYKHSRYTVERLSLQTLINTYPDSEYLAKAKLAMGDSYFKEGGTTGLTQAIAEYKDFITFFPFLDEAPYAQMQVAMGHYRMMEKADRDISEARAAEEELQTFVLKYPQSPLLPQAEQHLREVQEVLAEGDFRVARFYYIKASYRAAAARLIELTDRYPLYSQSDHALWMLADIYDRSGRNESEKAQNREVADRYYSRIVRDYPLSNLAPPAKKKLMAQGQQVPRADPEAAARMKREQLYARNRPGMIHRTLGILRSNPDVHTAAHSGKPDLTPAGEPTAATDVLRPGGGQNTVGGSEAAGGSNNNNSATFETVPEKSTSPDNQATSGSASSSSSPGTASPAPEGSNGSEPPSTSDPPPSGSTSNPQNGAPNTQPDPQQPNDNGQANPQTNDQTNLPAPGSNPPSSNTPAPPQF